MKKLLFLLPLFLLGTLCQAQRLEKFSENRADFLSELETFMTSSKRKVMIETYEDCQHLVVHIIDLLMNKFPIV